MNYKPMRQFLLGCTLAVAGIAGTAKAETPFMETEGVTAPPIGHVRYCEIYSADCVKQESRDSEVILTLETWRELNDINFTANALIKPVTDMEQYNTPERWDYPAFMGDCEDYVLLKRRMLHQAGWPLNALLITVVRERDGNGHAVLTVRTDRGDLILDNQAEYIVTWDQTPYRYLKRQSMAHSGKWTRIADNRKPARVALAR